MKKILFLSICTVCFAVTYSQKISYDVAFPNIVHHEAQIALTVSELPQQPATFRMSRSSPGRYATHEFGKNVYDIKAFDQSGKALTINRVDGDVYQVPQHSGYIQVVYTLYANHPDGTYAGIDQNSVHFNMPAAFLWLKGYDNAPITIRFNAPANKKWTIATQLQPTADPLVFTAPGLQYFMDSPVKIGDLTWKEWKLSNQDGNTYNLRLALEANTTDSQARVFAGYLQKITKEAQEVYGELPDFDYGAYTFIASINPWVKGDGMEHRNSTMISLPVKFSLSHSLLEVFSHEFFHCWNVERIRPQTLEPFNFEKSNMSSELWFAEGFTQYYGDLLITRAGLQSQEGFLDAIASLINAKENMPGAKNNSPAAMSRNAVFVDAGVAIDKNNFPNVHTSYYSYGGAVALALELELRTRFRLTLDDYMKAVWDRFGKPFIPYTIPGLEAVLAQVTNDKTFAADFFARYVYGHESFPYRSLLEKAGLSLKVQHAGKAWLGNVRYREDSGLFISSNTITGTPLYEAGLDIDDEIIQLDGKNVHKQKDISNILETHKPGDQVSIIYKHRDQNLTTNITLAENPRYTVTTYEKEGLPVTREMRQFRQQWTGSRVKE